MALATLFSAFSSEEPLPSSWMFYLWSTQEVQLPSSLVPPRSETAWETWTGLHERPEGPPAQSPTCFSVSSVRRVQDSGTGRAIPQTATWR